MSERKQSFRHDYIFLYYGITIKRIEMLGDKSSGCGEAALPNGTFSHWERF